MPLRNQLDAEKQNFTYLISRVEHTVKDQRIAVSYKNICAYKLKQKAIIDVTSCSNKF